jgi:hypothetical protein
MTNEAEREQIARIVLEAALGKVMWDGAPQDWKDTAFDAADAILALRPEQIARISDYRLDLAKALFQAAYQMRLVMWSGETRDYWLAKADAIMARRPDTNARDTIKRVVSGFTCTQWDAGAKHDLANEICAALQDTDHDQA